MLTPEFRLTNKVGITGDVLQEPLSFDLDDKGCFCSFLQNNFGSWKRFVLLLWIFPHVDLQQMHMHLMYHFLGAYWDLKSETHTVERFSQMFLTAISTATFFFAKATSVMMRTALTEGRRADRATAVLSARPRPGYKGDSQSVTRMIKSLCQHDNQRYIPPCRKFRKI